jgi:hypothetical protein
MAQGGRTGGSGSAARLRDVLLSHLPLILTFFIFVIVGVRLLVVARAEPTTAVAILESAGPIQVIFGMLVVVLPAALFALPLGWLWLQDWRTRRGLPLHPRSAFAVFVLLALPALFVLPWPMYIALGLGAATGWVLSTLKRRRYSYEERLPIFVSSEYPRRARWSATTAIVAVWVVAILFTGRPWVPLEEVRTEDAGRERVVVGFVLDDSDGQITVLRESDRRVLYLTSTSPPHRTICSPRIDSLDIESDSIADLVLPPSADYPAC